MAKKPINLIKCSNCSEAILPHRLCSSCGYYGKREVINVTGE